MIKVTSHLLANLSDMAKDLPRKRKNHNFHTTDSDPLQRMLNALESSTYVCPHRHVNPDKRETFIILTGKVAVIEFDDNGKIIDKIILSKEHGNYCAEIITGSWHTVISLEDNSVYYELKDGPYDEGTDKVFAEWAPEEESSDASQYLEELKSKIGAGK
jgi:cupin fold WbuC family metalloprotein